MIHYVLMLAYNNAEMTRAAIDSVFAQTIPVHLIIVNNGSTDSTDEMLRNIDSNNSYSIITYPHNVAPTIVANAQIGGVFMDGADYVLCVANDVILPPTFYEDMLKWPRGIIGASQIQDRNIYDEYVKNLPPTIAVNTNTHMAVILIRKWLYDCVMAKDGYFFDEGMFNYASDCDLALRISSCGIRGVQLNLPFWHYNSAAWRTQSPEMQQKAQEQANIDRAYFARKWGFQVFDPDYVAAAEDINFKGETENA